ncbi:hypothetical protein ES703_109604 [subsurface metagenome]
MEKGICKTWTPGQELKFEERIKHCRTFAERHLTMLLRDVLKYDGRSKESKRAMAQARLRLATATDEDLKELAELQMRQAVERPGEIPGLHRASLVAENVGHLKNDRARIREKGIKRSELVCR